MGNSFVCPRPKVAVQSGKLSQCSASGLDPLLLHFDVNKTVLFSDAANLKTIEDGIREGISEMFWGTLEEDGNVGKWVWTKTQPACDPPNQFTGRKLLNYAQYCKLAVKNKTLSKAAIKSWELVDDDETQVKMRQLLKSSLTRLQLPSEVLHTEAAEAAGLKGTTLVMLPALFTLVALLQCVGREFGVLFRSFGEDHKKIEKEWNAFCEMKHPIFSHLLEGIGPLDGTVPGLPDRRIMQIHTMYRDASGPLLILDSFTNGPAGLQSWDMWAKQKPKAKEDSRGGRNFVRAELQADCVDGMKNIAAWMRSHTLAQRTAAIKDDWAWWFWNGQRADAGKLLAVMRPNQSQGGIKQLFFDDNVEHDDARIVDCRTETDDVVPLKEAQKELLVKVNPVDVLNDGDLFLKMLQRSHGEHCNQGYGLAFQQFCEYMQQEVHHGDVSGVMSHQCWCVPDSRSGRLAGDIFDDPNLLIWAVGYAQLMPRGHFSEACQLGNDGPRANGILTSVTRAESTTITKLFCVAIQAMLERALNKLHVTGSSAQGLVKQCHNVLEYMAMAMQLQRRLSISAFEVAELLPNELQNAWDLLVSSMAFEGPHILQCSNTGGKGELGYVLQGIQSFLAAHRIDSLAADVEGLPGLETLLTDPWWTQPLHMLAEGWPARYVSLLEGRCSTLTTNTGDSFLHIAAAAGHMPVFQLLNSFAPQYQQMLTSPNKDMRWTPLHLAAKNGNSLLCSYMLEHKGILYSEDVNQCWPVHAALQHGHFQTARFLADKMLLHRELVGGHLQACSMGVFENKALRFMGLEGRNIISEQEFVEMVNTSFPELRYFQQADATESKRELCGLLAVYWIVSNQYNKFVRNQVKEECLSKASWQKLQQWVQTVVKLNASPRIVWTMLVFVAIMSVGKIKGLRMAFTPDSEEFNEALIKLLHEFPIALPSFARLDVDSQQLIMSCLVASEFNFGQFLQAENLPANLVVVKNISHGQGSILGFFLFKLFAAMCGILGMKSLEGSLFMNEQMFKNFKVGLDVLNHLQHQSPQQVYHRFLSERATAQGLAFNAGSIESRAVARLACMSRAHDRAVGSEVLAAFRSLEEVERKQLVDFLDADGITVRPAFLLYKAPELLENGRKNQKVGLRRAVHMLLQIYLKCAKEYSASSDAVVTVIVEEFATFAQKCTDPSVFSATQFDVTRSAGEKGNTQAVLSLKD
mmetsp:Transcript_12408/g.24118  ORF Transcript_12408/g.24118 Transcript_12408/m.24118 type:complete len:1201 (+) Transcript_12408:28-3630(+)